jgi:hypothetical protein
MNYFIAILIGSYIGGFLATLLLGLVSNANLKETLFFSAIWFTYPFVILYNFINEKRRKHAKR